MNAAPEEGVASHYRGEAAADYFRYQSSGGPVKGALNRRKFQPYVGPRDRLLDFGCGPGFTLAALEAGEKVGVDPNEHNRHAAAKLGIRTVAATREFDDESMDLAISNHALEHTLSPYLELCELYRVLCPGGKLVLCVPVDDWRIERQARPDDPNHHLFTWTPLLIGNLLREVGFDVQRCAVVNYGTPGRLTYPLASVLPRRGFDLACWVTAFLLRRREVMAVALRPRGERRVSGDGPSTRRRATD